MPALVLPTLDVHRSFLAAMAEGFSDPTGPSARAVDTYGDRWDSPQEFTRFIEDLRAQELEETPRPPNFVPTTSLWWVDGPEWLGRLSIRHRLAPAPAGERNGHIGYEVRPSARRRGHATAMLAAALPFAGRLGLESVLVTCDADNEASRRTIESDGGIALPPIEEKLRYRITILSA